MSLHIITKKPNNYFSREYLKLIARKMLGKARGPQAVVASLRRGLDEISYPYKVNEELNIDDCVYVNESLDALRWALDLKRAGKISRLVAGPNLVVTPDDDGGIIKSSEIDLYLMPSQWTVDFYSSFGDESLNNRMRIWAAGVELPNLSSKKRDKVLVYKKNVSDDIFNSVVRELEARHIPYAVLQYGSHQRQRYLDALDESIAMIYLQPVESQGIALLEAWAHDVPSLVFDNQKYYFEQVDKTVYGSVSAPYLNSQCGMFFQIDDFATSLDAFLAKLPSFKPRAYVEDNFTDKICAEKFLQIIK